MRNTTGYRRIAGLFYNTPLAILPSKLGEIKAFLEARFQGREMPPERIREITASRRPGGGADVQMAGKVGVVPCIGVLSQRGGPVENSSEPTVSCEAIGYALESLVADKSCRSIVLLVDSPGGSVSGVVELANKIHALKSEKKIIGMADSVAASAAYWIAGRATELCVSPGGMVGSIGVLAIHQDESGAAEQAGVKHTVVTSSKYKAEGSPFSPLSAEAKAELQSKVDAYHAMFVSAVARGRGVSEGVVSKTFGQGRMTMAVPARAAGMVDRVTTFQQLLKDLGSDPGAAGEVRSGYGTSAVHRPRPPSSAMPAGRLTWMQARLARSRSRCS